MVSVMDAPMRPPLIRKSPVDSPSTANGATFSWALISREVGESSDGTINIAHLAVDRHARSARAEKTAFRFLGEDGSTCNVSYRELAGLTDRFGNTLKSLDVKKGDRIALHAPNSPGGVIAFLAAIKMGAIVVNTNPIYTTREMRHQFQDSGAETIVTIPGSGAVQSLNVAAAAAILIHAFTRRVI